MSQGETEAQDPSRNRHGPRTGEGDITVESIEAPKSASLLPLLVLYQRAWDLAHATELSLSRLEHAAEAAALADAVAHLLADAGDEEGYERWTIRLSEARHWCAAVHDALAC
jgi:hypothetical protein